MRNKTIIYRAPIDVRGKEYWVPVVVKNKDQLVGMLQGMKSMIEMLNLSLYGVIPAILSSDRFNDVLPDGRRVHTMPKDELRAYLKNMIEDEFDEDAYLDHPDNDIELDYFFQLECSCGNFHGYHTEDDIPDSISYCELCGRVLIHYTGHDDNEYEFDGNQEGIESILEELKQEYNKNEDIDVDDLDDDDDELF